MTRGERVAYSVGLADDQRILREGLRVLLQQTGDMEVVGESESANGLSELVHARKPDLLITDLTVGGASIIEASHEWVRFAPDTKLVILSAEENEEFAISAIRAGAKAYVLKSVSAADLIEALREVARGGSYLSPRISDKLLTRIQRGNVDAATKASPLDCLSPRELQVLRLVSEGKTSKEIAVILDLGLQTIRSYRKTMMKKLNVSNAPALTKLAIAHGITTAEG
jgi:DNA-binding NarL/FixJ family response regulator